MGTDGKLVAGYILLGVGALLIVVAIILVIFLIQRRRNNDKTRRSNSPDTFKIVYKVPTANGVTTKVASDTLDARSVMTLRSEPGYRYVAPPSERAVSLVAPSLVSSPPALVVPRAASVDHVAVTLPRTGERYIVPAPNGTLPRILVPVVDKKRRAKRFGKSGHRPPPPRFVYGGGGGGGWGAASVISAPAYVTSPPTSPMTYGSTPNLAAASYFTQPVLAYDKQRGRIFSADDVLDGGGGGGGSSHVRNWLAVDRPVSVSDGDEVDEVGVVPPTRTRSRASSVPTDLEQVNLNALHARWSPSMRRRLDEMDRTEREHLAGVHHVNRPNGALTTAANGQTQRYSELAEEF